MYIHRGLLLVIIVLFVFAPIANDWINNSPEAWYRPFIAWAVIIFIIYRGQRKAAQKAR